MEERSEHDAPDGEPSAWLVVRIPADELTAVVERIEELGEPRDLAYRSTDVTRTSQDLDAAETALAERQGELESLRSERSYLAEQVAMSTMRIELVAGTSPSIEPGGFLGGLQAGWNALVAFAGALLVALGAMLPWLALLAVLAAVVVPLWRRRRARRAPAAPEEEQPEPVGSA